MKPEQLDFDDPTFVERLKSGDGDAFRRLVLHHQHLVVNTCYRFLLNREDAEDVAQDVFCEVYQSVGSFREKSSLSTWIYRIAVNRSLDALRKRKRLKRGGSMRRVEWKDSRDELDFITDGEQPDTVLDERERLRVMRLALGELPEKQQVAFVLKHVEGFSQKEIAAVLKVSEGAVESLMSRAKAGLRKRLEKYFGRSEGKPNR